MICIYSPQHAVHNPPFEVFNGDHDTPQEIPSRAVNIYRALKKAKFQVIEGVRAVPRVLLENIHDKEYLNFLKSTCAQLHPSQYLYPSVWPYTQDSSIHQKQNSVARLGRYIFDTYTPLMNETYHAALRSASLAYTAATLLHRNPKEMYYALCRPPGHHAEHAMAGGYCYINNAAVAAHYLSKYGKVATLDVDFHHGNGTQHIFNDRSDVLTVSIHADPLWKFPYYSGFTSEAGEGHGTGYNHNYPLRKGTTNTQYDKVLQKALRRIHAYGPQYLVVSYGADTHRADPIGGFALTTRYYTHMARSIRSLGIPTMVVQEGGYNNEHLGNNVVSFLKGLV